MVIYGRYADIYRRPYTTTRLTCRIKHTNTKYRQIPPNTAKYRQIPPNTAKYRQIPPNTAKYRQIPPNTADAVPTVITPLVKGAVKGVVKGAVRGAVHGVVKEAVMSRGKVKGGGGGAPIQSGAEQAPTKLTMFDFVYQWWNGPGERYMYII